MMATASEQCGCSAREHLGWAFKFQDRGPHRCHGFNGRSTYGTTDRRMERSTAKGRRRRVGSQVCRPGMEAITDRRHQTSGPPSHSQCPPDVPPCSVRTVLACQKESAQRVEILYEENRGRDSLEVLLCLRYAGAVTPCVSENIERSTFI